LSPTNFFKLQDKNDTTFVNKNFPDESKFYYNTLEDAINNVSDKGTVYVENGIFDEQLVISKPLKLVGNNKSIVDLSGKSGETIAIKINSSNVEIMNLTFKDCYIAIQAGTNDYSSSNILRNISLSNNTISSCSIGLELYNSQNVTITNNKFSNFSKNSIYIPDAIDLINCSDYSIGSNYINGKVPLDMIACGIYLERCGHPDIYCNEFNNCRHSVCYRNMEDILNIDELNSYFNKFSNILDPICNEESCQ